MQKFHFLNVSGSCSIIEHKSLEKHVSVIDVSDASLNDQVFAENWGMGKRPENPIKYMNDVGISEIFRLVITHPDMDHIDGLADLFKSYPPTNFYYTRNKKKIDNMQDSQNEDWKKYKKLCNNPKDSNPRCLMAYSGDEAPYRTQNWEGNRPGDGFHILSPTLELVEKAIEKDRYNDASYVILYCSPRGGRILISGDSLQNTWDHILENHKDLVENVDLLIAPHHGRKRDIDHKKILDVLNPKMTFFGNADSNDLAYDQYRKFNVYTSNQAGNMVVICNSEMALYVQNEDFARKKNSNTISKSIGSRKMWFLTNIRT